MTSPLDVTHLACIQTLAWRRGTRATWRTVQLCNGEADARQALDNFPRDRSRVLLGVEDAACLGALTRDSY